MMLSVPRWENPWVVVAFLIFTGSAFGMNLLVILIATLCNLWGPGKALRGNDSVHLHDTIEILERQQQIAMPSLSWASSATSSPQSWSHGCSSTTLGHCSRPCCS